ncbi:phosphoribosyl-ATP pyrophosphohydrolase [Neobacillus sp. GCM10023253]|uniref:phosphoribosyl-ATP pyrophosphohydrolase n=1 Tax=Neobacillus sp. GCM10023253 TaxID=3252644 RepID=UPI003610F2F3
MPLYNKLVRDKIPDIIGSTGKKCSFKVLNDDEYIKALQEKCYEELDEYVSSSANTEAMEELADLLEIFHSLADYHGISIEQIEEIRKRKLEQRGGFQDRIFLIEVEDK